MDNTRFPKEFIEQFESSYLPLVICKVNLRKIEPIYLTNGFTNALSLSKEEALRVFKNDPFTYAHPDDKPNALRALDSFLSGKSGFDEAVRCKYGAHRNYHPLRIIGKINSHQDCRYAYFYFIDLQPYISHPDSGKKASLELDNCTLQIKQDIFDPLTGLPVMSHFIDMSKLGVESICSSGRSCAFLCFDFSGMKSYNLRNGNQAGDDLIKGLAKILSRYFSPFCLGRFGADHFYAYAPMEGIEGILNKIFDEAKRINGGNSLPVRAGVYAIKDVKRFDPLNCCDKAKFACDLDRMTYQSHFSYFAPEMERSIAIRDYVLSHVEEALEKRWIKAYYQPIIRSVTGSVCAEEALCRWEDPTLGLIQPNDFIPYLEEARLLYKVDLFMVSLVVEDFKKKQRAGLPLVPVSVNLSRYDFEQGDVVNEIKSILLEANFPPSLINVEITEAVAGHDQQFTKTQIKRFHDAGFKVWMDDFGTGYSSLNVLSELDFDLVKLDMKFLKDFSEDSKSAPLLSSVIEMAQALDIDTLCEGVETREQLVFLINHGCDKIQGYYYRKPEPINKILYGVSRIKREKNDESPYYEAIGSYCLDHPLGLPAPTGAKTGILEYQNGTFHFLRGSEGYRQFLEQTGAVNFSSFSKTRLPFLNAPVPSFISLVEKAIASGNPESAPFIENGLPVYQVTVKEIARKEGPHPSYALYIDLEPSSSSIVFGSGVVPEYEGRVLYDEKGQAVNILFLRSNPLHEAFCGIASSDFVNRKISDVYGANFDRRWLELAQECVSKRTDVRGEHFSTEVMHDVIYRFSPRPGSKDEFVCRFFELTLDEFSLLQSRNTSGCNSFLYQAAVLLTQDPTLSCISLALGRLNKGVHAKGVGYYAFAYGGAVLKHVGSLNKDDLPGSLSSAAITSIATSVHRQGGHSEEDSSLLPFFPHASRLAIVPVNHGKQALGYLVCVDYPLDHRNETVFCLQEMGNLISPRLSGFAKASEKNKAVNASLKPREGLRKTLFPSVAEKRCLDSYNMGFLCFGSIFYSILVFTLSFLNLYLAKANLGLDLYYEPSFAIPRYVSLGVYAVFSLLSMGFAIYYRKSKRAISRKVTQSVLLTYIGLTCLLGVILSWQDCQIGLLGYIYILSLLYVFACFRLTPWKSFIFLFSSFALLTMLVYCVPCMNSPAVTLNADVLYWGMGIGTIVISSFLIMMMFYLFIRMLRLSTVDPLTQSRNRFALDMDKNSKYGRSCILMLADIDDFKHWNDTYGHERGDALLIGFASALMDCFGEDAVYRYGGDEFVVLSEDDRATFQKRVANFKGEIKKISNGKDNVSFTAGFKEVCFKDDPSFLACVSECDKLLYEGKKSGKSIVVER